ncbi:MAG: divalent-cation tolerance protein CutA [bacterium]
MNLILVYITNPSKAEAKKIAEYLLKKRLAACVNIFPIESMYRWQGKIVDEKEFVLIAKTKKENFNKVKKEVEKIHSYSIPCLIQIPAKANEKYFKWLKREVS